MVLVVLTGWRLGSELLEARTRELRPLLAFLLYTALLSPHNHKKAEKEKQETYQQYIQYTKAIPALRIVLQRHLLPLQTAEGSFSRNATGAGCSAG